MAEMFSTAPLKPQNGIFGPIGKTWWPPCPLIYWGIFDFSETAEWNSKKFERKQDRNVLYQVCGFFRADWKNKMTALVSDYGIVDFSNENALCNSTKLDGKHDLNILYQVYVFHANRKNKMAALTSEWLRHFWLLLWNRWTERNMTESKMLTSSTNFVFFGPIRKLRWPPGLWSCLGETNSTSEDN